MVAHDSLKYFIAACFVVIFFLAIFALLDGLIDERKILATPTIPKKKAIFTALASTKINASAEDVWKILIDFNGYGKWNPHVVEAKWESVTADGAPLVGTKGKVKVQLPGKAPFHSKVEFTMIDRETKIMASKLRGVPNWVLRAERVYEVSSIRKDLCEFRTYETFGGLIGFASKYFGSAIIQESGKRCAEGLQNYVENLGRTAQPVHASDSLLYH